MPSDQCIDCGYDCLSLAVLVPTQISALVEPLGRVVITAKLLSSALNDGGARGRSLLARRLVVVGRPVSEV
jgi:hypothetical protein